MELKLWLLIFATQENKNLYINESNTIIGAFSF